MIGLYDLCELTNEYITIVLCDQNGDSIKTYNNAREVYEDKYSDYNVIYINPVNADTLYVEVYIEEND